MGADALSAVDIDSPGACDDLLSEALLRVASAKRSFSDRRLLRRSDDADAGAEDDVEGAPAAGANMALGEAVDCVTSASVEVTGSVEVSAPVPVSVVGGGTTPAIGAGAIRVAAETDPASADVASGASVAEGGGVEVEV